jgi:hypothetical protein
MRKKITIDHDPEATFLYIIRLPDVADVLFTDDAVVSATIEVPVDSGYNQLTTNTEWLDNGKTRIKVNGGSLLGAPSARLLVKIKQYGVTYTTDPIHIKMVG